MEKPQVAHRGSYPSCRSLGENAWGSQLKKALSGALALSLAGCSGVSDLGQELFGNSRAQPVVSGYIGAVVADEPQAALIGRDVLAHGGNAADAAAAVGMALAVTLPSRASLGGGGACLASRAHQAPQAFLFLPAASQNAAASRPAALPMTPRGLFTMQLRYGSVEFSDTLKPAIRLARYGTTVSRALGTDLAAVESALLADDSARTTFTKADGGILKDGDTLSQPRLANFLERLSNVGVGDLYNGALGSIFVEGANSAGGGLDTAALRAAIPAQSPALQVTSGNSISYFLPPPADGGYGAASVMRNGGSAQGAVAAWRAQHHETTANAATLAAAAQEVLDSGTTGSGTLPALPASTAFVVTDNHGGAVACALTNNNLFGTGRIAEGTGVLLAASPQTMPTPLLSAAIVQSRGVLRGALASSGQNDAADALAAATRAVVQGTTIPHEGSGRVNSAFCRGEQCSGDTDPRGGGLATGTNN
ncbi:gamma-glutamyltransferase [Kozakia baliensis]|uniref:gamma-glutamyltransferase n=1 Tax=Kozakia baliensis TaxID=153496 RepID=UPI0009F30E25|nr:gamma-glutamyltransferase [Kozakia baliensis]GEL64246.1 gamma-glutamyltranspeptidase [Kozakia baliensis]